MATVVSTSASQYKGKEIKTLSDGSKVRVDSKTGKSGSGSKNSIDTTSQAGLDAFAAENTSAVNPALNSQSLAPAPDLKLPTPPQQPNYEGALSSATTTVKAPSMYDQTAQPESDQYNLKGMIDAITQGMDVGAPPNTAAIYAEQERRDGIQQKQQLVNDYTAQLNAITAKAEADKLRVTGQGRGIPEVIIGGQQAQIAKEAAIEALPVAAQLAAAQGNLETAQQHVATYAKLLIDDANAKYQHKQDIFKTILPFLNAAENRRLQVLDEKNRQTREDAVNLANAKAQALSFAIQNGAPSAVRTAITSATDLIGLTSVAGGYGIDPLKTAQLANIRSEIAARNASTASKSLGGTLNGKPQTAGQATLQGYAERTSQADSIIDRVGAQFSGVTSYLGQLLPNFLKGNDRQQYEQAQRNFVNAVLRRESGAVISDEEFSNARQQYFPQPGDKPDVITQKAANRQTVINNLYQGANILRPATPGSVIESDGKRYLVGEDGETLTEI